MFMSVQDTSRDVIVCGTRLARRIGIDDGGVEGRDSGDYHMHPSRDAVARADGSQTRFDQTFVAVRLCAILLVAAASGIVTIHDCVRP